MSESENFVPSDAADSAGPNSLPRVGVNIDHIATLRQLRGTPYPDLLEAARLCERAGAAQITVHLREDRRHIQDEDVKRLRAELRVPLNLEMAIADEIVRIATKIKPAWACLVPEKRREVTTEGGLDVIKQRKKIAQAVTKLKKAGIRVSLFIEPSLDAVRMARELRADAVEFHTGKYCLYCQAADQAQASAKAAKHRSGAKKELERIRKAALLARKLGIHPHAGHGFDYVNVRPVAELQDEQGVALIEEYNIGHSIVCRAAFVGMENAVREMISAVLAP